MNLLYPCSAVSLSLSRSLIISLHFPPLFSDCWKIFLCVYVYFNICTQKEKYVEDFLSSHKSLCVLNIIKWVCRVLWLFLLSWPVCLQPLPPQQPPLPHTASTTSSTIATTVSFRRCRRWQCGCPSFIF